jgi:hypothetical protein
MPIPVPTLDDRTFEQLVTEGRSLIPRYSKEWTNHNPSDPGITLLELLAYLTETTNFQLDQIPDASIARFLELVDICRQSTAGQLEAIDQTLERALNTIGQVTRAVTAADFDVLARQAAAAAGTPLARTALTSSRDVACAPPDHPEQAPLATLLIVVPDEAVNSTPTPALALTDAIFRRLTSHRLLTTRFHVIGPEYVEVEVELALVRKPGSNLTPRDVEQAVRGFLHALRGGPDRRGWPFGRPVYYSEMFQQLESLPQVDHVEKLTLSTRPPGELTAEGVKIPGEALVFVREVRVQVAD